jgi:membrane protease YdiL (CAAX protease family)
MLSQKPWNLERVLVLGLGMAVFICNFLILGGVLQHFHGKEFAENSLPRLVLGTLAIQGSILLATFGALAWFHLSWRDTFGWAKAHKAKAVLLGAGTGALFVAVAQVFQIISLHVLAWFHHIPKTQQEAVETLKKVDAWDTRAYFVVFSILIAPVAEEILFRGVIYPFVKQAGFPRIALWGTSLLFAAIHLTAAIFIPLMLLGMVLIWLYETTDNLLAPIAAHSVFNAVNLILFFGGQALTHPAQY